MKRIPYACLLLVLLTSCVSTKMTLKNVDNNAPEPKLLKGNLFEIKQFATDQKYGYDKSYPINLFYRSTEKEDINATRFLNALAGPNGEKIFFRKVESCCPFPTKRAPIGAGFLDIYEVTWVGQKQPIRLYLNIYEKSTVMVPVGFTLKK